MTGDGIKVTGVTGDGIKLLSFCETPHETPTTEQILDLADALDLFSPGTPPQGHRWPESKRQEASNAIE